MLKELFAAAIESAPVRRVAARFNLAHLPAELNFNPNADQDRSWYSWHTDTERLLNRIGGREMRSHWLGRHIAGRHSWLAPRGGTR